MREDIKIEINGKMYVGWEKISKKVKISASLLRARVNKLGWNLEKAVNTSVSKLGKTGKEIFFKGKHYQTQEDFVSEIEKESPFTEMIQIFPSSHKNQTGEQQGPSCDSLAKKAYKG